MVANAVSWAYMMAVIAVGSHDHALRRHRGKFTTSSKTSDCEPARSFLRKHLVRSQMKQGGSCTDNDHDSKVVAAPSGPPETNSSSSSGDVDEQRGDLKKKKAEEKVRLMHELERKHKLKRRAERKHKAKARKLKQWYCPSVHDYDTRSSHAVDNDSPHWGAGWVHAHGFRGIYANRWTVNLVGGRMDVDGIDISGVGDGINANVYTTAPQGFGAPPGMNNGCDSMGNTGPRGEHCLEMDLMESAGRYGYATTWQDQKEGGRCGVGGGSCQVPRHTQGKFGLRYMLDSSGCPSIQQIRVHPSKPTKPSVFTKGGDPVGPGIGVFNCGVSLNAHNTRGAMIKSTQWGNTQDSWAPDIGGNLGNVIHGPSGVRPADPGALGRSVFAVRGLRFYGTIKQGRAPRTCWQKADELNKRRKMLEAKRKKHVEHVGKHTKHHEEVVKEKKGEKEAGNNSTTAGGGAGPETADKERAEREKHKRTDLREAPAEKLPLAAATPWC